MTSRGGDQNGRPNYTADPGVRRDHTTSEGCQRIDGANRGVEGVLQQSYEQSGISQVVHRSCGQFYSLNHLYGGLLYGRIDEPRDGPMRWGL